MPLTHTLRDRTIWVTTAGDVDFDDGLASLGRALAAARAEDATTRWDVVFDVRDSNENRSGDELRGIAGYVAANGDVLSGRCVILAGDDFHFGLSRMFQAYCEQLGLRATVVREPAAVEEWLASERG